MKYRKKPVVIEAWNIRELDQLAGRHWSELPNSVSEAYELGDILFLPDGINIRTKEGIMHGNPDDMLIRGVAGEFYACKPDIFAATYEPAEESSEVSSEAAEPTLTK